MDWMHYTVAFLKACGFIAVSLAVAVQALGALIWIVEQIDERLHQGRGGQGKWRR